jgi:hypothetical protein
MHQNLIEILWKRQALGWLLSSTISKVHPLDQVLLLQHLTFHLLLLVVLLDLNLLVYDLLVNDGLRGS